MRSKHEGIMGVFVLVAIIFAAFSGTGKGQELQRDVGCTVITAVAPPANIGAFLFSDDGKVNVRLTINSSGEVIKAALDDKITWTIADDGKTVNEILANAKKWRFSQSRVEVPRSIVVTFWYRAMPPGTPDADLTTVFSYPYTVEIRMIGDIKTKIVTDIR